jgi:hypothetical protein
MIRHAIAALAGLLLASPALAQLPQDSPPKADAPAGQTQIITSPSMPVSTGGRVTIILRPQAAPNHVERIKTLVRQGFYNGVVFHRVIDGFMAQTGDPQGHRGGRVRPSRPQGRIQRAAACARRRLHGPHQRARQRQQPVLHHVPAAPPARPHLYRFRPRDFRHELGRHHRTRRAPGQPVEDPPGVDRRRQQAPAGLPGAEAGSRPHCGGSGQAAATGPAPATADPRP